MVPHNVVQQSNLQHNASRLTRLTESEQILTRGFERTAKHSESQRCTPRQTKFSLIRTKANSLRSTHADKAAAALQLCCRSLIVS